MINGAAFYILGRQRQGILKYEHGNKIKWDNQLKKNGLRSRTKAAVLNYFQV